MTMKLEELKTATFNFNLVFYNAKNILNNINWLQIKLRKFYLENLAMLVG